MRTLTFKQTFVFAALFLLTAWSVKAQTFIKQLNGAGTVEPRIFSGTFSPDYYIVARTGTTNYVTRILPPGNLGPTNTIDFNGDVATIRDIAIDWMDGTLAGIAMGNSNNYVFRYDFNANSMVWLQSYPTNYVFQNIHHTGPATYVITGEILTGQTTIFEVDRPTGSITTWQNAGFVGEFFSTFDGSDIYGACRYYTGPSTFNPCVYKYDLSGNNLWTTGYIANAGTIRVYPVAPVVDAGSIVTLCSGDATSGFNTYLTGPTDAWLLKSDMAGNLLWSKKIIIPGYPRLNAKKIINTASGYYLLIDSYNGTTSTTDYFFVVKTDKNGNLLWGKRYGISGVNTVITGIEDAGDLLLTVTSSSYAPGNNTLFLRLDPNGMANTTCGYIIPAGVKIATIANNQAPKPTGTTPTGYTGNPYPSILANASPTEQVYCSPGGGSGGSPLPCGTLTGSLASGVLAFYPFGNGSLLDVSGNNFHLNNSTAAFVTPDRGGNKCAYRFMNTDFLDISAAGSWFLNGITNSAFSISLWYQPINTRPVGNYELLIGRGNTGLHCPDTWGEWSLGLYDCRKAVAGLDMYSHWETPTTSLTCQQLLTAISNNWHHAVFVYDGSGNYTLYIDNVPYVNSHGPCGWMSGNIGQLMLGVDYMGDLDDIIIYNRALTAAEVNTLYTVIPPSCCDGVSSSMKPTGTSTIEHSGKEVKIYPNPSSGLVTIEAGAGNTIKNITVYNNIGVQVSSQQFSTANASLNLSHLPSGLYMIKVNTDAGETVHKLTKE